MPRRFRIEQNLEKIFFKLSKKDRNRYNSAMKKIQEIINCTDINHYKNLRRPLNHLKRVHIDSHFVLTFKYIKSENLVIFYDLDHHDRVYR